MNIHKIVLALPVSKCSNYSLTTIQHLHLFCDQMCIYLEGIPIYTKVNLFDASFVNNGLRDTREYIFILIPIFFSLFVFIYFEHLIYSPALV